MYHFDYVPKKETAPVRKEIEDIIHDVQKRLRKDGLTFMYFIVGSAKRNMITCDRNTNIGYDFDYNIEVNKSSSYTPAELRTVLSTAFKESAAKHGYLGFENSSRVFTIKKYDNGGLLRSGIDHSCDFAVVRKTSDRSDGWDEYIDFDKYSNRYCWARQPEGYGLETKINKIKEKDRWNDVKDLYLKKKNINTDSNKKSRSLFAETINEIYRRL